MLPRIALSKEDAMASRLALLALIVLGVVSLAPLVPGQDPAADDKQTVESKATKRPKAASVPVRQALSLPYPSLNTLGSRIDAARRANDPVALANAASELNVAESVSGKKASLTSSLLMKESAELAQMRKQQKELEALLRVNNQITGAQETNDMLKREIAQAQERARAHQMFQEPTWEPRKLIVNNYTTQFIDINVNGNLRLQIPPGETRSCMIEHRWNPVVLTAYGDEDEAVWGPRNLWGRFKEYTWNLQ
jgi:hypothetical protein